MSKLSKKFILGIIIILGLATTSMILFNTKFVERYYVFQKKSAINEIGRSLSESLESGEDINEIISEIEEANKVIILEIDNEDLMDNDEVNDKMREAFQLKGIGFQNYWLWEEDYDKVLIGENRVRLYSQDQLNYSLLIEYISIDSQLYAITMIIPNISDAFSIINTFLIFVNSVIMIIASIFIFMLIKKITNPLEKFEEFANHMGQQQFVPLEIHTKDELEEVADHLNLMGSQILSYQKSLEEKNNQMEQLLDDVAHELKTPISLIKLYADGIRDYLDDGTFLETISQQNNQMDQMVNQLLFLTRIEKEIVDLEKCEIASILYELLDEYEILVEDHQLHFIKEIQKDIEIYTNEEWLRSILSNLITNAIKYSSGKEITLSLHENTEEILFMISNEIENDSFEIDKIWNPYYVGEKSRNKHLSGTGLGLSMVKKLTEKLGYDITCILKKQKILFTLRISQNP